MVCTVYAVCLSSKALSFDAQYKRWDTHAGKVATLAGKTLAEKVKEADSMAPDVNEPSPPRTNTKHNSNAGANALTPIEEEVSDSNMGMGVARERLDVGPRIETMPALPNSEEVRRVR
jgi:hypothetical protein